MSTTYSPRPGTVAYRAIAVLEMRPNAEHTASHIALELGGSVTASDVAASLAAAVQAGAVHKRQRDRTTPRAPWYYSLTDLDKHARLEGHVNTWPWMQRTADADVPVFIARGAEPSTVTPKGDQAGSEPAREVMEPEACESAAGRGTTGAPALATLPHTASPGVGPMGAGQPADAGPTCDESAAQQESPPNPGSVEPAAPPAAPPLPPLVREEPREADAQFAATIDAALAFRAARYSDGTLATERDGVVVAVYSAAETDAIQRLLGART